MTGPDSPPTREAYYRVLAECLPDHARVVTSLGNASYLWACLRDRPENFYVEDAMGLALPVALGLAVAQPLRKVVAVEGDGALLMHLGVLVTVGAVAPRNLTVLLIQNGVHAASGGQPITNPPWTWPIWPWRRGWCGPRTCGPPRTFAGPSPPPSPGRGRRCWPWPRRRTPRWWSPRTRSTR